MTIVYLVFAAQQSVKGFSTDPFDKQYLPLNAYIVIWCTDLEAAFGRDVLILHVFVSASTAYFSGMDLLAVTWKMGNRGKWR